MIFEEDGEQVLSADNIFLYSHDLARLHMAINLATAENLQFMFLQRLVTESRYGSWCDERGITLTAYASPEVE